MPFYFVTTFPLLLCALHIAMSLILALETLSLQ